MKIKLVNNMMLVSLMIVILSGFLVKIAPGMWLGITHGVSGIVLAIAAVIHCVQHSRRKGKGIS